LRLYRRNRWCCSTIAAGVAAALPLADTVMFMTTGGAAVVAAALPLADTVMFMTTGGAAVVAAALPLADTVMFMTTGVAASPPKRIDLPRCEAT
jgi:hypothetical protein